MKFEVGDRVVRINSFLTLYVPVGTGGVIKSVSNTYVTVLWDGAGEIGSYTSNLQLEHIYNSPLEQALR